MNKNPKICGWSKNVCECYICSITGKLCNSENNCPLCCGGLDKYDKCNRSDE